MKSLNDVLKPVKEALLKVTDNVGHYEPNDGTKSHIVYAEDSSNNFNGDNFVMAQSLQGTIDLYELGKGGMADKVQEALNKAEIAFYLNSVQFENSEPRNFIHYEWVFEVS